MGYAQFLFVFVVCLFVCSFNVQCYCCLLHARFCFALLKKSFLFNLVCVFRTLAVTCFSSCGLFLLLLSFLFVCLCVGLLLLGVGGWGGG